jgi:hypothetical protein
VGAGDAEDDGAVASEHPHGGATDGARRPHGSGGCQGAAGRLGGL